MGSREVLLRAIPGWRETMVIDSERPDDLLIKTYSNPQPFLDRASALSNEMPGKDLRHAAVIPEEVLDRAMREGWANDQKAWRKWANDAANAHLRTWKGRL